MALSEDLLEDQIERFAGKSVDIDALTFLVTRGVARSAWAPVAPGAEPDDKNTDEIGDVIWALIKKTYEDKEALVGGEVLRRVERDIMLHIVDGQWKDHLYSLDHLKEGIGLRGYGQRDPLVEYKKESFSLFQDMKDRIEEEMVRYVMWLRPVINEDAASVARPAPRRATPSR
jgi:preprotein translocase subunit SecA